MQDGGMRRRLVAGVIGAGLAGVLILSGCTPTTVVSPAGEAARTVSVVGTGTAEATPDAARASLTVESIDPASADAAQAAAAAATNLALGALKAAGVAEADIATQTINVGPVYEPVTDGSQTINGYRASQTLLVTLRDLTTAGATLDSAVKAGGSSVRIDYLEPYVSDTSAAMTKARAQAVEVARAEAEQYASLLGFTLGAVANVSESAGNSPLPPMAMAASLGAPNEKSPTPIEAGTSIVTITVNVAWLIAG